jgi:hypothetical protein
MRWVGDIDTQVSFPSIECTLFGAVMPSEPHVLRHASQATQLLSKPGSVAKPR